MMVHCNFLLAVSCLPVAVGVRFTCLELKSKSGSWSEVEVKKYHAAAHDSVDSQESSSGSDVDTFVQKSTTAAASLEQSTMGPNNGMKPVTDVSRSQAAETEAQKVEQEHF